ncbi:hypothetical protein ERJ75_000694900 [Trypanosoma vivax]|nr:hypothetical protein ERJ75_000694900 [Trypanosoma vivax]
MQRVCLRRMDREVDNKGAEHAEEWRRKQRGRIASTEADESDNDATPSARTETTEASGRIQERKAAQPKQQRCCTASARDDAGTCARGRVTGQRWAVGNEHERNADAQAQGTRAWAPGEGKEGLATAD